MYVEFIPVSMFSSRYNCLRLWKYPNSVGIRPLNWLKESDNTSRSLHLYSSDGISPPKLFRNSDSILSLDKFLHMISKGRLPESPFIAISITSMEEILNIPEGTEPESWFWLKFNILKLETLLISTGILPYKKLYPIFSISSFVVLNKEDGIIPVKLLLLRISWWSSGMAPNHGGSSPEKLLLLTSNEFKKVRFPRWGAIFPSRFKLERFKAITLLFILQETPNQSQNEEEEDQFAMILWGSEVIKDLKARSADSSILSCPWHIIKQFVLKKITAKTNQNFPICLTTEKQKTKF